MKLRIRREPLTYTETGQHSFFRDMARWAVFNDPECRDRLMRHQREVAAERRLAEKADEARYTQWSEAYEAQNGMPPDVEQRVNPNSATGTGGEFDPPLWLEDKFASASRAGRPLGDLLNPLPLPPGVSSINIPRMSTGTLAATQTDGAAVTDQDIATVNANSPVVTIAGQADVSQQLFDLAPHGFDAYAWIDLNRAYNKALETQLISGTGSNGQLLGVTNVSNITSINGSSGTTVTLFWTFLGQACAGVGNSRLLPPEIWLMAPRRWFFIAASLDNSNRPLTSPGGGGSPARAEDDLQPAGGAWPVGPILGLPVYMDGAIPAGTSTDSAIVCRPSDMFLFEGTPRLLAAANPLAGELQIRLSYHRYVAFVPQRYPSGIGVVTALPAPSNY